MKALLVIAILLTFGLIFFLYSRNKDMKKLFIALGSFVFIIALGIVGNITRPVIPFFLAHIVLIVFAWAGLLYYMMRDRYVWWLILSPVVTIVLFVIWSLVAGSRYEDIWGSFL
jgi:hypothetical protein